MDILDFMMVEKTLETKINELLGKLDLAKKLYEEGLEKNKEEISKLIVEIWEGLLYLQNYQNVIITGKENWHKELIKDIPQLAIRNLAIIEEFGEAAESLKYHWWKKSKHIDFQRKLYNIDYWLDIKNNFFMELVDITHFVLTSAIPILIKEEVIDKEKIKITDEAVRKITEKIVIHELCRDYTPDELDIATFLNSLIFITSPLYAIPKYFYTKQTKEKEPIIKLPVVSLYYLTAFISYTKTFKHFYNLVAVYISKMVLNVFRQRNGYKEGTYIKIWDIDKKLEDNYYLTNVILPKLIGGGRLSYQNLLSELEQKYKEVIDNN